MSPSAGFDPGENDGYDATTSPARYRSYAGAGGSCRCETKPCFVRALVAGVLSAVAVTRSAQRGVPQPWLVGAGVVAASVLTRLVLARALHRADLAPWDAAAVVLAGGTLLIGPSVHLVPPGHRTPTGACDSAGSRPGTAALATGCRPASARPWSVLVWCDPHRTPIAAGDPR